MFAGKIHCPCGYHITIIDGILDTENRYMGAYDRPDLEQKLYKGMPDDFYKYFRRGADKCVDRINQMDLKNKLVLETHINGYSFLYNYFQYLKNDCIYVITDKYLEIVQMYKEKIEQLGLNLRVLFITDAGVNFPLKKGCIRLLINFFGDGEHQLYFKDPLVVDTARYFACDAEIVGTSILFREKSRSLQALREKYPEGSCGAFQGEIVREYYRKCGYCLEWETLGSVYKTPEQLAFVCHMDGEPLTMVWYIATRR